ncbi:hypothetical protein [Marinobacter gelidimuriae]|uniref:hypothetical protein n=1 Tax=Marinobacter gelidimuriae TaxID=2739064 RepID=UPI0003809BF8|nr:hypothetical protein [Marinobacter gelidimuriae]
MIVKKFDPTTTLSDALAKYHDGFDPALIELPESAVFPYLIAVQPTTARKARCTGTLLGRPAPRFVRHGRAIRYRLKDVLNWLVDGESYASTAEASETMRKRHINESHRLEAQEGHRYV